MQRLSDVQSIALPQMELAKNSYCRSFAKTLMAADAAITTSTKEPPVIAEDVIRNSGRSLTMAERRSLPTVAISSDYDAFQPEFCKTVLTDYSSGTRFWSRLFRAWIRDYRSDHEPSKLAAQAMSGNYEVLNQNFDNILDRYRLFEKNIGVAGVIQDFLNDKMTVSHKEILGLSERGVISSGIARAVLQEAARALASSGNSRDSLSSFTNFVFSDEKLDDSVRVEAMIGLILGASQLSPSDEQVTKITKIIETSFPDPVVGRDQWPPVPEILGGTEARVKCLDIVKKWQAFQSINLFFRVIGQVVDGDHKHQFPMRRDFWLQRFNDGLISDAWVVLGPRAGSEIKNLVRRGDEELKALRWGRLRGGYADQSVLLMQVGSTTVMEFSHIGRVRIWGPRELTQSPQRNLVPKLHRPEYTADEMRAPCPEGQMFRHDPGGNWRIHVASCLRQLSDRPARV